MSNKIKLYKNGAEIEVDKSAVDLLTDSKWSTSKPSVNPAKKQKKEDNK